MNAVADPGITTDIATLGRPLAWYADNCGEIGSICNGLQATINIGGTNWTVTKAWSRAANDCITTRASLPAVCTGPNTPAGCRSCSCADDGQGPNGCSGATPRCDTAAASPTHGQCIATAGTGGAGGGGGSAGGAGGSAGAAGGTTGGGAGGSAGATGGSAGGAGGGAGAAGGSGGGGGGGATGGSTATGGTGGKPDGTEGGACYGNSTCNTGLTCLSHLCVTAPKSGGGCGCTLGGSRDASALAVVALVLGIVATRARRRRRRD